MDIETIKICLNDYKGRLTFLESLNPDETGEYDVEKAIKQMKNSITEYQKCFEKTTEEHKQLCKSLEKEFPIYMIEHHDIETLRAFNKVMNDDSLSEIEKSTWYMLIANYKRSGTANI